MPSGTIADPAKPPVDTRPAESSYDEKTDTWTIGTNDFANINVDELAKYAKVVMDKDGKTLGIQITEEIPDNNVVIARGGKKGDIIKAINGKPVRDMSAVRGIVIKERDAGVETFVVDYERGGVPGQKTIKVPKKK
jgi:membrane-associated protease RseP (regulator of RpoE activity)